MGTVSLRRYTELAATIHLLRNRKITLLSPALWDDKNDSFFLSQYKKRRRLKTVLALCFAETHETYHHWRVFSHGSGGTCLEFDKDKLLSALRQDGQVQAKDVDYRMIEEIENLSLHVDQLPFVKRFPYKDEKEFRVIYTDTKKAEHVKEFDIPLECVRRIILSPWMPAPLVNSVRDTLRSIDGCSGIRIHRSSLVENEKWKNGARLELSVAPN